MFTSSQCDRISTVGVRLVLNPNVLVIGVHRHVDACKNTRTIQGDLGILQILVSIRSARDFPSAWSQCSGNANVGTRFTSAPRLLRLWHIHHSIECLCCPRNAPVDVEVGAQRVIWRSDDVQLSPDNLATGIGVCESHARWRLLWRGEVHQCNDEWFNCLSSCIRSKDEQLLRSIWECGAPSRDCLSGFYSCSDENGYQWHAPNLLSCRTKVNVEVHSIAAKGAAPGHLDRAADASERFIFVIESGTAHNLQRGHVIAEGSESTPTLVVSFLDKHQ
mmetsp:Transcript_46950/g.111762  ORF Transcript_46950/g.111762 Transcript_46950/m.111762 type:complete len:276 (-) Transcript_46950:1397-2224(-)